MLEICYHVVEEPYEEGQWETYAVADTEEEAMKLYEEMKSKKKLGDYFEGTKQYLESIGVYDTESNEFIVHEW